MALYQYRGIPVFARGIKNIIFHIKKMGERFSKDGTAQRQALKEYESSLKEYVRQNLSGHIIPKSKKTLNDKTLLGNTFIGRGGKGSGVASLSIRVTGTNQTNNMIGRAKILDKGGKIKAKKGRFLTIPLGRRRSSVKPSVLDYTPRTTFQIYQKATLRTQPVTKRKRRLAPRYLVVRGAGRAFNPVYLFATHTKIPAYQWIQDASERAFKDFTKESPFSFKNVRFFTRKITTKRA